MVQELFKSILSIPIRNSTDNRKLIVCGQDRIQIKRTGMLPVLFIGADGGIRTPDPFITSEVLYQLSYVSVLLLSMVEASGVEPLSEDIATADSPSAVTVF